VVHEHGRPPSDIRIATNAGRAVVQRAHDEVAIGGADPDLQDHVGD
jgi:hypothetical protein